MTRKPPALLLPGEGVAAREELAHAEADGDDDADDDGDVDGEGEGEPELEKELVADPLGDMLLDADPDSVPPLPNCRNACAAASVDLPLSL